MVFFFKLECGELEWSAEREYGVIHFGKKSVILFDTREYAQIKWIWKSRPKNWEKGKAGRFKIIPMFKKGKAFDPPQRLSQIFKKSIKQISTEILVFKTE